MQKSLELLPGLVADETPYIEAAAKK